MIYGRYTSSLQNYTLSLRLGKKLTGLHQKMCDRLIAYVYEHTGMKNLTVKTRFQEGEENLDSPKFTTCQLEDVTGMIPLLYMGI